jgi:hypothetical protein
MMPRKYTQSTAELAEPLHCNNEQMRLLISGQPHSKKYSLYHLGLLTHHLWGSSDPGFFINVV